MIVAMNENGNEVAKHRRGRLTNTICQTSNHYLPTHVAMLALIRLSSSAVAGSAVRQLLALRDTSGTGTRALPSCATITQLERRGARRAAAFAARCVAASALAVLRGCAARVRGRAPPTPAPALRLRRLRSRRVPRTPRTLSRRLRRATTTLRTRIETRSRTSVPRRTSSLINYLIWQYDWTRRQGDRLSSHREGHREQPPRRISVRHGQPRCEFLRSPVRRCDVLRGRAFDGARVLGEHALRRRGKRDVGDTSASIRSPPPTTSSRRPSGGLRSARCSIACRASRSTTRSPALRDSRASSRVRGSPSARHESHRNGRGVGGRRAADPQARPHRGARRPGSGERRDRDERRGATPRACSSQSTRNTEISCRPRPRGPSRPTTSSISTPRPCSRARRRAASSSRRSDSSTAGATTCRATRAPFATTTCSGSSSRSTTRGATRSSSPHSGSASAISSSCEAGLASACASASTSSGLRSPACRPR